MKKTDQKQRGSSEYLLAAEPPPETSINPELRSMDSRAKIISGQQQDIRMRFLADPQTHEVTILIFDKISLDVLRTISPKELAELHEGELIDLIS